MSPIDTAGTVAGAALLIPALLSQVALWQRKEYRFDRMWAHISTPAADLHRQYYLFGSMAALTIGWITYIISPQAPLTEILAWAALAGFIGHHVARIRMIGVVRPRTTLKSIVLMAGSVALVLACFIWLFSAQEVPTLQVATFNFLLPAFVAIVIPAINLIFYFPKRQVSARATAYRKKFPNLAVVGITGSYGKTSTKHFLYQLLTGTDKNVAATKEHCNSYNCVAQDMLDQVTKDTDIYIAEMGAYRRGEIRQVADIAQPTVGVLTIIGTQHLHLFGSQENILEAKWELAESLPKNGVLIINNDDPLLVERAKSFTRTVMSFSTKGPADIFLEVKAIHDTSIAVVVHMGGQSAPATIPLASPALLSSVAAAVAAAHALQVPLEAIVATLPALKPFAKTMEVTTGLHGATVIDDSYSAGEVPVKNAIEHLSRFSSPDKRIVLVPVIELGNDGPAVHRAIGELIKASGARTYIFGETYKKELKEGAGRANIQWYTDPAKFVHDTTQGLSSASVVLLEGRIPAIAREHIISS